ncbi:unnamed protein product [Rotaria sp. Silwood1]|nr:unnamed protein product [Rotaria sp. Silwood1]CAF4910989.1 unnamed protein product [Rotaria sp. Silwood1]
MAKPQIKVMTFALVLLIFTLSMEIVNGQLCTVNCGNGYCCPASHPLCVQGLPKCCPIGTIFYYNGYCYKSSGRSDIDHIKLNATEAALTVI